MLRVWLVYVGTIHPTIPTVLVIPASPQIEASQLPKVFISNSSLTFLMAGKIQA